jgi:transposase
MMAPTLDQDFVQAFRTGTLTEAQAAAFAQREPLELTLLLLQLSLVIAAPTQGPHTPSGSVPVYEKPTAKTSKRGKVGAKPGHVGKARATPQRIDKTVEHLLPACPDCGGQLNRTGRTRKRIIEDLPETLKSEVTEHTIHRDWCPCCKKQFEPKVADALPQCMLGHRVVTLSAWLHYGLGTTTSQIVEVLNGHLHLKISEGGLTEIWHRLANVLTPWYDQIRAECLAAPVLHADETGWRLKGQTWWLWCAATPCSTYYWIDASRGHAALNAFFEEEFAGVLVTDFWKAYDAFAPKAQKCWAHLLRDVAELDQSPSDERALFAKQLKRIFGDGVRLKLARDELGKTVFDRRMLSLHERLYALAGSATDDKALRKLKKRLTPSERLLNYVELAGVDPTNNKAEREIRPAVLMRKASYGSMSEPGSVTRSVLMSIYRTLKQRGVDPLSTTTAALQTYTQTGTLPPLPNKTRSEG